MAEVLDGRLLAEYLRSKTKEGGGGGGNEKGENENKGQKKREHYGKRKWFF